MKQTRTDRSDSIAAEEFIWDTGGTTEVHRYLLPPVKRWLMEAGKGPILDLGCGNGSFTAEIASCGTECSGIDFSESGIALAKKHFPGISFAQASLDEPLPSEHQRRYLNVVAIEVIEHLLLPRTLFARAKEALQPGGRLTVSTPFHGYWKNLAIALTNGFDRHWHPLRDYGHVKFFSEATLVRLFEEEGFKVEGRVRVGRIPALARSMLITGKLC